MERDKLKPVAENYFPDIIGTNLQYAVEGYVWKTHVPMTGDGKMIWDKMIKGRNTGAFTDSDSRFTRRPLGGPFSVIKDAGNMKAEIGLSFRFDRESPGLPR